MYVPCGLFLDEARLKLIDTDYAKDAMEYVLQETHPLFQIPRDPVTQLCNYLETRIQ